MFKTEKIVVKAINVKSEKSSEVYNFTRFLVFRSEADRLLNSMKQDNTYIEKMLPHASWKTVTKEELAVLTDFDYITYLNRRTDWKDSQAELDRLDKLSINDESYNALSNSDRVFLSLQAHTAISRVGIDSSCLNTGKTSEDGKPEKYDFQPILEKYFSGGKMSDIKKNLVSIFNKIISEEGALFYGVKLKKSDFSDEDVREFCSIFGGKAGRTVKTKEDKSKEYGYYKWQKNYSEKNILSAISTLFAVVLDRDAKDGNGVTVIKPEAPEKQETSEIK